MICLCVLREQEVTWKMLFLDLSPNVEFTEEEEGIKHDTRSQNTYTLNNVNFT